MEITEEKLYAAFGVTPGENDPEPAEPEETEEDTAPEEPEAEPEEPEEEPEEGEKESEPADQTPEQRRENAARRRQQEMQEAINAAVRKAMEERDEQDAREREDFFKRAGLVNPFSKTPITNMNEFEAWEQERENQTIQNELANGKLTRETLERLIDRHPAVQAAREVQEQEQEARKQQEEQAFLRNVEQELQEIRETDPSIKTVADLLNKPYSKAFYEAVQKGNSFKDAFYLATRGQQIKATEEAARQSAVDKIRNKDHLRATSIGGKAGATVTSDERDMFRLFNPKATDEEIQRFKNKDMKR